MKFWLTKEAAILEKLEAVLEARGYVKTRDGDHNDEWRHPELGVRVELRYMWSYLSPIRATVSLPEDSYGRHAWDAVMLAHHLIEVEHSVTPIVGERPPTTREIE